MPSGSGQPSASGVDGNDKVPEPGEVIASKYEVTRVLGVGGMGVVLEARHLQLGQKVAIKFMRRKAAMDGAAVGRFQREARAAAALTSEHVTKVFDVGTLDTGAPYIVLEYLAGVDLGQIVRRDGPMPYRDAIGAVLQACEALAEAHALGIVHRDLKPSNLFATRRKDGSVLVKVLDFGISKAAAFDSPTADQGLTASGYIMGSPGYMSPEQVRSAKAVDARSDVWALGVILYELVTGVAPFEGESLGDTFARIVSETPAPLTARRPDVPEGFAATVARCLERDVSRRFQNVAELASALAPYAPPESALSIERILRVLSPPGSTIAASGGETIAAPGTPDGIPFTPARQPRASRPEGRVETGPPWQKSQPGGAPAGRRSRWPWPLAAAAGATVAVAGSIGVYALRRTPEQPASAASGSASVAAAVPVAPTAEPRAAVTATAEAATGAPSAATAPEREPEVADGAAAAAAVSLPTAPAPAAGRGAARGVAPAARPKAQPANDPGLDGLLERRQ